MKMPYKILLLDDQLKLWRSPTRFGLNKFSDPDDQFEVKGSRSADLNKIIKIVSTYVPDVILLDYSWGPGRESFGADIYNAILENKPDFPIIVFSVETCNNVFDRDKFNTCPTHFNKTVLENDEDLSEIKLWYQDLICRIKESIEKKQKDHDFSNVIEEIGFVVGSSSKMNDIISDLKKIAHSELSVLFTGETGTGKTDAAFLLHKISDRSNGPFVEIRINQIPEGLIETELFGNVKAIIHGAEERNGRIFAANKGTLFIDEIGDIPIPIQDKIKQFVDTKKYYRVGDKKIKSADVRIVTATNKNLKEMVENGEFKADLWRRINQSQIDLPPLRERIEDIQELSANIIQKYNKEKKANARRIVAKLSPDIIEALEKFPWEENIGQLKNFIYDACVKADGNDLQLTDFPNEIYKDTYTDFGDDMFNIPNVVDRMLNGDMKWSKDFKNKGESYYWRYFLDFSRIAKENGYNSMECAKLLGMINQNGKDDLYRATLMKSRDYKAVIDVINGKSSLSSMLLNKGIDRKVRIFGWFMSESRSLNVSDDQFVKSFGLSRGDLQNIQTELIQLKKHMIRKGQDRDKIKGELEECLKKLVAQSSQ